MSSSTRTTAAQGKNCVRNTLSAQFVLSGNNSDARHCHGECPNHRHASHHNSSISWRTEPAEQRSDAAVTAPLGGIILKGTAINPATGRQYRHLWVADATSGICRIDPDLDSPGPYVINLQTCPFKINGASITGGPMSFDPTPRFLDPANPTVATNYLYFADEQRASQGIMRIGYLASGDSGHGFLNFASVFVMGGNTTGARFGGGTTGCALPGNPGLPDSTVLDPSGRSLGRFQEERLHCSLQPAGLLLLKPALAHAISSLFPWP